MEMKTELRCIGLFVQMMDSSMVVSSAAGVASQAGGDHRHGMAPNITVWKCGCGEG